MVWRGSKEDAYFVHRGGTDEADGTRQIVRRLAKLPVETGRRVGINKVSIIVNVNSG